MIYEPGCLILIDDYGCDLWNKPPPPSESKIIMHPKHDSNYKIGKIFPNEYALVLNVKERACLVLSSRGELGWMLDWSIFAPF